MLPTQNILNFPYPVKSKLFSLMVGRMLNDLELQGILLKGLQACATENPAILGSHPESILVG